MSHYEERLQADLDAIEERVVTVGGVVRTAVGDAVRALLKKDRALAAQVILGDHHVNREIRAIDRKAHAFVARHLPSAGILRFVSSVLRLDIGLERIGDYAVSMCRQAVQLSAPPPTIVLRDLDLVGDQTVELLGQALEAFHARDVDLARRTMRSVVHLAESSSKIFGDLTREGESGSRPIPDLFSLLLVFNRLERVSDQAKNICEEAIFVATGQVKSPKRYRVLFLDERNDRASKLAELIARKGFPESGEYASAGWSPAEHVDPGLSAFLDRYGYDAGEARPEEVGRTHDELAHYHVIVALQPGAPEQLGEIPLHTVLVEWELAGDEPEELSRELAGRVADLMHVLRGEDAG